MVTSDIDARTVDINIQKTTPRGKPEKGKILALILYLSGISMSDIGKIVGVTAQIHPKVL